MKHFLLVYDRGTGELVTFEEFRVYADALNERFRLERVRTDTSQEIVVLTSESKQDLERTHARYFKSPSDQLKAATG